MPASIYVADDEPVLLNAIVKRLTQGQHKVRGFKSGDELLAAVEQEVPDLVLLDIKMPRRTGLETLEEMRKARLRGPQDGNAGCSNWPKAGRSSSMRSATYRSLCRRNSYG